MPSQRRAVQRFLIAAAMFLGTAANAIVATLPSLTAASLAAPHARGLEAGQTSGSLAPGAVVRPQTDDDDDVLDGPVQVTPTPMADPLDGDSVADVPAPAEDTIVVDDPLDGEDVAVVPVTPAIDPLDGEVTLVVLPPLGPDPLDGSAVAVVPVSPVPTVAPVVAGPVATVVPVAVAPVAPVAAAPVIVDSVKPQAQPVDSVRSKESERRVVVVNGTLPAPATLASCDVAVVNGRLTVGAQCDTGASVIATQPIVPRVGSSSALIAPDAPPLISSRRDGAQIGALPQATLGDSIAFAVQSAIFPEDVVVPGILLVPGTVTVAGNQAREDPIILWRSELEAAAARTGVPAEYLASVIQVASRGNPGAQSADGVGLMRVPVAVLQARGIPPAQWFDPAINIAIGAELIAAGTGGGTDAAVEAYLAGGCDADDVCVINSTVDDWVVYYRLRMTGPTVIADSEVITDATVAMPPGWPFEGGVDAADLLPDRAPVPIAEPSGSPYDRIQPGPGLNP